MTKNDPLRSVKCLSPDNPFCLPCVPTDEWTGDLWMATGEAYGPRLQHCLSCLHCCTCHSEKTQGRVSGQRESHQSLWPFNLLVASPTGLCVGPHMPPFWDLGLYHFHRYWQGTCLLDPVWLMKPRSKVEVVVKCFTETYRNNISSIN